MVTAATMSTSSPQPSVQKSTLVRSESAPPTRGYETAMPISNGSSSSNDNTNGGGPSTVGTTRGQNYIRQLPPKQPGHRLAPATGSGSSNPGKKRRAPTHQSATTHLSMLSSSRYFHPAMMDYPGDGGGGDSSDAQHPNCSLAMSRTESIMVSSSGDVIVCRCRRSSAPFIPTQSRDPLEKFDQQFPCCDTDILSVIDGPWSPVFDGLSSSKSSSRKKALSSSVSTSGASSSQFPDAASIHTGAVSTYEWEKNGANDDISKKEIDDAIHVLDKIGLARGSNTKKTSDPSSVETTGGGSSNAFNMTVNELSEETHDGKTVSTPPLGGEIQDENNLTTVTSPTGRGTEEQKTADQSDRMDENRIGSDDGGSTYSWENTNISEMLLSLPSFDYSHIHNGHNDMVPTSDVPEDKENSSSNYNIKTTTRSSRATGRKTSSLFPTIAESSEEKKDDVETKDRVNISPDQQHAFFHGVPIFLSSLSQVRISKVSAHPLGAHVLMISAEAMLFTYGLNNHGQLGIGFKSPTRNATRGFHVTPTLITPLLENGGKTINCAAGVDHSLVIVSTEGRRLQKLQTQPGVAYSDHVANTLPSQSSPCGATIGKAGGNPLDDERVDERFHFSETSVQHHQVYGFGRNNFMKLGLISPFKSRGSPNSVEPIPAKNASSSKDDSEDVVLPRRVALHCTVWPQEDHPRDKDLPPQGIFDIAASVEHSAALIRRPTGDVEVYMWGNSSLGALGLPIDIDTTDIRGEIARKPTFKKSAITPFPTVVEKLSHRRNSNPSTPFPVQISLGPYCSFVVLSNGKCMSFGFSAEGMLGQAYNTTHTMEPQEVFLPPDSSSGSEHRIRSVSAGAFHVVALSEEGDAFSWGINSNDRLGLGAFDLSSMAESLPDKRENLVVIEWVPQKIDIYLRSRSKATNVKKDGATKVTHVCAGYDGSIIVTDSGQALSFGKKSGRLGMGELSSNINTPQPLYGGLHLFHRRKNDELTSRRPRHVMGNRRAVSTSTLNTTM